MLCALFFTCVCECVRSITMTIKLQAAKERKYNFCKPIRNAGTKGEYSKQNQMINESSKQMLIKHNARLLHAKQKAEAKNKNNNSFMLCCLRQSYALLLLFYSIELSEGEEKTGKTEPRERTINSARLC